MVNLAASISLYSATSINAALDLPVSIAAKIFESKAFEDWKKSRESEAKTQAAIVGRLNEVIRGIGILAKSGRRF
jgi:hypothetical protein